MSPLLKPPAKAIKRGAFVVLANLALLYLLLLLVEFFLPTASTQQSKANQLELSHQAADKVETTRLLGMGYKPKIYPDLFSNGMYVDFMLLAKKYNIAPLTAQPNTKLIGCNEGYGFNSYKSDRFGFRNADALWDEDEIEVLLIGDSFAHGSCVPEEVSIAGVLNNAGLKTINVGSVSNSPIHYAALSKTIIPKVKPRFAVIVFYANDNVPDEEKSIFYELYFKNSPSLDVQYFDSNSKRLELSKKIKSFYEELTPITENYKSIYLAVESPREKNAITEMQATYNVAKAHLKLSKLRELIKALFHSPKLSLIPFGTKLAVDTLLEYCNANTNCTPIVVYIPNSSFWRPDPRAEYYKLSISNYAHEKYPNNLIFLDCTDTLKNNGQLYAPAGPHLSKEGYRAVSLMIEDKIKSRQSVSHK